MLITGNIISGEFDEQINEFSLYSIKHLSLESTINESQLKNLCAYLKKHEDDLDGQIVTLYDQMPIWLSQQEISLLLDDLEKVQSIYDLG